MKILLDADVVIHFIKAGKQLSIASIFPKHKLVILDKVYDELKKYRPTETIVDNILQFGIAEKEAFPNDFEILREYATLTKEGRGEGESACMAVARLRSEIIASSNLKDIKDYCRNHSIIYLTTMDFLCQALENRIFTEEECDLFISTVKANRSRLPVNRMSEYRCKKKL